MAWIAGAACFSLDSFFEPPLDEEDGPMIVRPPGFDPDEFEDCGDGIDNDRDGDTDCEDFDSCEDLLCGPGSACRGGECICVLGQAPEDSCRDRMDNDCDGFVDCADADCAAQPCDPGRPFATCTSAGACIEVIEGERACGDGLDNDDDGLTDCDDDECLGRDCGEPGRCPRACRQDPDDFARVICIPVDPGCTEP